MNCHTHRTIYNHTRGCLMAVAETASSSGKASGAVRPRKKSKYKTTTCRKARSALCVGGKDWQAKHSAGYGLTCLRRQFNCLPSAKELQSYAPSQMGSGDEALRYALLHFATCTRPHLFVASQNINTSSSSSASSISISYNGGFGGGVSASGSNSNGNGADISYSNTNVNAGNVLSIRSGGNTTLAGAVASGNTTNVQVAGNLNIISLQDQSNYGEQGTSSGFSVSGGGGQGSGSISAGRTSINSNFLSVNQTSGIQAGDGGFNITVGGNTNLVGGLITSNQSATLAGRNSLNTTSLTTSDLNNSAVYSASSVSVTLGAGAGAGFGTAGGSASSTTLSGISGGNITVGGVTTNTAAGQTLATSNGNTLNTNVTTGQAGTGITPIFNLTDVRNDVQAQVAITQAFGMQASRAVGDYAAEKMKEAQKKQAEADKETDPDKKAALQAEANEIEALWGERGTARLALHTLIGGLTGGVGGAMGAAAGTITGPIVAEALEKAGITGTAANAITAIAATLAGGLVGGTAGAVTGFNEVTNNYLSHPQATKLLALQKKFNAGTLTPDEAKERDALILLDKTTNEKYLACTYSTTPDCLAVKADFAAAKQSFLPTQADISKWAQEQVANGSPFSYGQLMDAYNNAFMTGNVMPAGASAANDFKGSSGGDLLAARDWIVAQLSCSGKPASECQSDLTNKVYMGWANANAPSVAGGVTAYLVTNQALNKVGGQVGSVLGAIGATPTPMTATGIPDLIGKNTTPFGVNGATASVNSEAELASLFKQLTTGGTSISTLRGTTMTTLVDGTTVQWRPTSGSGGAAIQINYKGSLGGSGGDFKIHINQ